MKKLFFLLAVMLVVPALAFAIPLFTGSLSTPSEVVASGNWDASGGGFKISWTVSQITAADWYYQYTLSNAAGGALPKDPSHLIIEISGNTTDVDFWGSNGSFEINTYSSADPSNPGMPGAMYGTKMEGAQNSSSGLFEYFFHSDRAPTWGDFYCKDGKTSTTPHIDVTAWNTDFLAADPTDPAQSGLLQDASGRYIYKLLRPDTATRTSLASAAAASKILRIIALPPSSRGCALPA